MGKVGKSTELEFLKSDDIIALMELKISFSGRYWGWATLDRGTEYRKSHTMDDSHIR